MKEELLLKCFIETMRLKLAPGENLAAYLRQVLSLGKEAVYRRLRGDVPFTFEEAALISQHLRLSLDELLGGFSPAEVPFYFTRPANEEGPPVQEGVKNFNTREEIAQARAAREPGSESSFALNMFPVVLIHKYAHLLRFRLFKCLHQRGGGDATIAYGEVVIHEGLLQYARERQLALARIDHICMILDRMIFEYMVNDIQSFARAGLLDPGDVASIKRDMLLLLDELERMAATGQSDMENKLEFYLSDINFESTYTYTVSNAETSCAIGIFSMNSIYSLNHEMFRAVKEWVDSLKQLSCLITKAGEVYRWQFFKKQRELLDTL
ncbi:MAG: hypothetical protein LBK12_06610 [Odoribacteraceae bacterium]|jgi:hypothetical protein|nr:hypothetical protein [Odoribacteraceae bacterium]